MRKLILFTVIAVACAGCAQGGQWYGGGGIGALAETQR
jgi:hypothetical protein